MQKNASDMNEILVVVGPTASGKSAYAIRAALETGAEIISADSMQVYRRMDIGTAKIPLAERAGIPHHMIDVADPNERYSVSEYQNAAYKRISEIIARKKKIIIAGGAGLYISALVYNIKYPEFAPAPDIRLSLERKAIESGAQALHMDLENVDAEAAAKIHVNDLKRIIRALEVFYTTGKPISEHARQSRNTPSEYNFKLIGLNAERGELYERIDARVDGMIKLGLVDEARALFTDYGRNGTAAQAIGYKEFLPYFDGARTLEDAVETIKTETRRYAKRQLTWFRNMPGINWINC